MEFSINLNIIKTSHPFSAIMGTLTGVIISWKFLNSIDFVMKLGLIFFLAQFLTGIMNDYLDYESDLQFQPLKITSRGGINRDEIRDAIILNIILLFAVTLILLPLDISFLVFFGTLIAQSYNFKFKDTPLSGIIFVISFGIMALVPYILEFGYSNDAIPIKFIVSGLLLSIFAHLVNDLVDYEIDLNKNSNSLVITLGRTLSIVTVVLLLLFLAYLQNNFIIFGLIILIIIIVVLGIKDSSYKIRELIYYFVVIFSILILIILPVE